jgi:hypothetical protein
MPHDLTGKVALVTGATSGFGGCLRRAASRMTFPAFRGEPVGARIPLRIGAAP